MSPVDRSSKAYRHGQVAGRAFGWLFVTCVGALLVLGVLAVAKFAL